MADFGRGKTFILEKVFGLKVNSPLFAKLPVSFNPEIK
jgi:hypothetical protein